MQHVLNLSVSLPGFPHDYARFSMEAAVSKWLIACTLKFESCSCGSMSEVGATPSPRPTRSSFHGTLEYDCEPGVEEVHREMRRLVEIIAGTISGPKSVEYNFTSLRLDYFGWKSEVQTGIPKAA